jgi:hypothetical protein
MPLDISYPYTKFGIKWPKQIQVIEIKLIGVNRPKQTRVNEQKEFLFLATVTLTLITDIWEQSQAASSYKLPTHQVWRQ